MSPRVSLSLPVYNGDNFIAQAIQSILDQDFEDLELVITDNASTDRTEEICLRFAAIDPRIRYFRNERNLGAAANFNLGYKLTSGEYFKWCSHDDFFTPDFLRACVRALDENDDAVITYGRPQGIDKHGHMIAWRGTEVADFNGISPARRFKMVYTVKGFDNAMFGLFRRDSLAKTTLLSTYIGADIALLAEMAVLGRFLRVPDVTFYNREHPDRSVNIVDRRSLQTWWYSRSKALHRSENLSLLCHLFKIAHRYREIVPLHQTLPPLLSWAITPRQLSRCALDLIGIASPSLRSGIRKTGWEVFLTLYGVRHGETRKERIKNHESS